MNGSVAVAGEGCRRCTEVRREPGQVVGCIWGTGEGVNELGSGRWGEGRISEPWWAQSPPRMINVAVGGGGTAEGGDVGDGAVHGF